MRCRLPARVHLRSDRPPTGAILSSSPSASRFRLHSSLRARLVVRRDWGTAEGGDTVQIRETVRALEKLGVAVTLAEAGPDAVRDLEGADVVHLFHLDRPWENLPALDAARRAGVPVVLSPIFWPMDELDLRGRPALQRGLARALGPAAYQFARAAVDRARIVGQPGAPGPLAAWRLGAARRALLDGVSAILPNSEAERAALAACMGDLPPVVIVPNGVDVDRFTPPPAGTPRDGVLCVGRLEPRKNQQALIRALRDNPIPLTLVGPVTPRNRRYAQACRRSAGARVRFLDAVDQGTLNGLYQSARIHCCPSWYETPGLANLEAALAGCRLALARRGAMPEYFGGHADFFEPADPASIRAAIARSLAAPRDSATLMRRIRESFTWQHAAARTLEAYERALAT